MSELTGARPVRLLRYGDVCDAVADGLEEQAGALDDSNDTYLATHEPAFRYDCAGEVARLRTLARHTRDLGRWVAGVGQAFVEAGAWTPLHGEDRAGVDATVLDRHLDVEAPALVARGPRPARPPASERGPSWWSRVDAASDGATVLGGATRMLDEVVSADPRRYGAIAPFTGPLDRGVGVGGAVLDAVDGAHEGWTESAGLPTDARVEAAALHGGLQAGGGGLVGWGVAAAGFAACGPICAGLGAVVGSGVGSRIGGWIAERFDRDPGPGQRDHDDVRDEVADTDDEALAAGLEYLAETDEVSDDASARAPTRSR